MCWRTVHRAATRAISTSSGTRPKRKLRNKVLLPVLGDHYGRILETGELRFGEVRTGASSSAITSKCCRSRRASLDDLLAGHAARCRSDELAFLADQPRSAAARPARPNWTRVRRRHRDKEVLARPFGTFMPGANRRVAAAVDEASPRSMQTPICSTIYSTQNYRLAFWRTADQDLGYRRFFDINTLVGLRTEDETVFRDTHALVLDWLAKGMLDGVRVDHPDGLRNPQELLPSSSRGLPAKPGS